jgi:exosome complex exonuclease DIS3/RRP44
VHGDIVAIQILPESEWRGETDIIIEEGVLTRDENAENEDGDVEGEIGSKEHQILQRTTVKKGVQVTAKVVGIIKRNWRTYVTPVRVSSLTVLIINNRYVGHIDSSSIPPTPTTSRAPTTVFVLPQSKHLPKIRIRTRRPHGLANQRLLCTIDAWPATSRYPEGHFVRALGAVETREAETEALLIEWDVVYRAFSERVLACLPTEGHGWKVPDILPEGRKDFRDRIVCSIDPVGKTPHLVLFVVLY